MQASCDLAKSSVGNSEEPRQHLRAERADPKNLALTYHLWSWLAASRAAGAVLEAVDQVCNETARNAFCCVRPPGHHLGPAGAVDKQVLPTLATTCLDPPDLSSVELLSLILRQKQALRSQS
ncbi:Ripk4 [Symbiodinium sp. KB8]|nr:Ripk4 [Symbiodinium sp. KB8]